MTKHILTSESVTPGHPDKVCDQISDAILDAYLAKDPKARVAVEVMATAVGITIGGELRSSLDLDHVGIARKTLREIGYTAQNGLDPDRVRILDQTAAQSQEIAFAVDNSLMKDGIGAGDQGIMFGYATDETASYMPLPLLLARSLTNALVHARRATLPWLRPDGKAQVTVAYENGVPVSVPAVVVSTQHDPEIGLNDVREALQERIVRPVLAAHGFDIAEAILHLNPAGAWTFGGPAADTGLTGRKIIVDTYGGAARHGGGAFSGKDPSKVDRSAAYAARQAARWLVSEGYAQRAEVQLSYAIGVSAPVSIMVETFGTSEEPPADLGQLLYSTFDFSPSGIIERLDLARPQYTFLAGHGHFGHPDLAWES